MKKTNLLSPDKTEIISVLNYMEEYYLLKGYHRLEKNYFAGENLKKIYYKFSRKFRIIINLILKSNFAFESPKQKDIIIYDCSHVDQLLKIVPKNNYKIISTRVDRIKKIYISKNIITFIIFNFFTRSLKQNYIAALVKIISPKVVITNILNSSDFHITAKIFENSKIKFLAVQSVDLAGSDYLQETRSNKIFFIQELLCFSSYDKELFNKSKCNIKKFAEVGSLKSSLANEHIKINKININPEKYDICLISEPYTRGDFDHVETFDEAPGIIAEYTHRLCKQENLNLIFSGKSNLGEIHSDHEIYYYKEFLKKYDFKISQVKRGELGTHFNMMQSKMIIGHCSTALREAFSFEKKVLVYNYTGHPDAEVFPVDGLCLLRKSSYEEFKDRVLKILLMTKKEYQDGLSKKTSFVMNSKIDAASFTRNRLKEIVE